MLSIKESIEISNILEDNEMVIYLSEDDIVDKTNKPIYPIVYVKKDGDGKPIKTIQLVHTKRNGNVDDLEILQGLHYNENLKEM